MTTQQQQRNRYWSLKALSATRAELRIYGIIDTFKFFDEEGVVTPGEIAEELDAMGPDISAIDVFVNSPGGNVFAGQAIHSMLVRHRAEVTVTVDGLAASIASVIAMAGDRVLMPANALMMLHDPMALAFGNAAEMRKMASVLDTVREGMVEAYMRRWSGTRAALVEALQAETWYTAAEAKKVGFIDSIEEPTEVEAHWDGEILVAGGLRHEIAAVASHRPELGTRANADQRPTPVSFRERASRVSQEVYDLAERIEARHANRLAEGRPVSSVDREALEQIRDRAAETLEVLDAPTAAEQAVQLEAIHLEREFQNIQGR